ncbi:MAG TPA: chorismate mutase [Terriglobales bacterium]|nr:chorismate mutase [Terriglobales bacterium]
MDIAEWRKRIDELDRRLVELLNARALAAKEIGKLKRDTKLPVYEPDREKVIHENVRKHNRGPLPDAALMHIYERIIDVMRKLQRDEIGERGEAAAGETELEPKD